MYGIFIVCPFWSTDISIQLTQVFVHHRFPNKTLLAPDGSEEDGKVCSFVDVEEAKAILRLTPIWTTCLVFAIVFFQSATLYLARHDDGQIYCVKLPNTSCVFRIFHCLICNVALPEYDTVLVLRLNNPKATVPVSIWWLIPQYLVYGISQAFTMIGLQEFFYDQAPTELKSIGLSLLLRIWHRELLEKFTHFSNWQSD